MKLLVIVMIIFNVSVFAQPEGRGTNALPPKTLGQESYPNSGLTKSRSNDVTGEDTATATMDSSDVNPIPTGEGPQQRQEENVIEPGPYDRDGNYRYFDKDE